MDVARTCFVQRVRFWRNDDTTGLIRWYRCPVDAPALPMVHSFSMTQNWDDHPSPDPESGQVGVLPYDRTYDLGKTPFWCRPNGHFTGTPEQWLDGSVRGSDLPLTLTAFEFSKECLAGMGVRPIAQRPRTQTLDGINDL